MNWFGCTSSVGSGDRTPPVSAPCPEPPPIVCAPFRAGTFEMQGRRPTMEDAHVVMPHLGGDVALVAAASVSLDGQGLFAVFDGHGGPNTSAVCAAEIPKAYARSTTRQDDMVRGLTEVFDATDKMILVKQEAEEWSDGSTGAVVVVDTEAQTIYHANVGDTEVLVLKRTATGVTPEVLSFKHHPEESSEKVRIEQAGGSVSFNRVSGRLAVSRAFGDKSFKSPWNGKDDHFVTSEPFCGSFAIEEDNVLLLIACDGVFETLSYQQVADACWASMQAGGTPTEVAEHVVRTAYGSNSQDNISAVAVFLHHGL